MAGQVRQLHRHAREAGAGPVPPGGGGCPARNAVEQLIHQLARAGGRAHPARHLGQHEAVLMRQHRTRQVVLAAHMVVERALGDARLGRDLVQARALEALAIEQCIGRGVDARAGGGGVAGHCPAFLSTRPLPKLEEENSVCILRSVYIPTGLRPTILENPEAIMAEALTIRSLTARAVVAPLARPLRTASGEIPAAPLLLIDIATDQGITGRAYLFGYTKV